MSISRDAKSGSPRRLLMETQDNRTDLIIYLNIMHNNNSTTRFAALLVATIFACLPSLAGWVYYDNSKTGWTTPTVYYWGGTTGISWPGTQMTQVPSFTHIWKYYLPDGTTKIIFSAGGSTANKTQTENLDYVTDHVYIKETANNNVDGQSKGGKDTGKTYTEYTGSDPDPDPDPNPDPNPDPDPDDDREFWIEPANATQLDGVTLWYNTAKNSTFKDWPDDLYAYIGIVEQGKTNWTVKADWNSTGNTDDCKFKRSEANRNLYYIKIEPSIVEWFNGNASKTYDKLNFIARSKDGKKQSPGSNQQNTITLATVPPEETIENFGAYKEYKINSETGQVEITGENGTIYLSFWTPEIVKVFTLRNSAVKKEPRKSISVVPDNYYSDPDIWFNKSAVDLSSLDFTTSQYGDLVISVPDGITVTVKKQTCLLEFEENGKALLSEKTALVNASKGGLSSVTFNGDSEHFYGGGYNGSKSDLNDQSLNMNNTQTGGWHSGYDNFQHNICVPYIVSSKGYGLFFDSNYMDAKIKPSTSGTTYNSNSSTPVAYYFIGGGTMEKAMQNYTLLTGRQELPPYWALGYITSKFSFADKNEAETVVRRTKDPNDANLPLDGIVFDIHWQGQTNSDNTADQGFYMGHLDWDTDKYSNPKRMLKDFSDQGVHSIAIAEPFFNSAGKSADNFNELKNKGFLADERITGNNNMSWIGGGNSVGLIDATNPEAARWFGEKLEKHLPQGDGQGALSGWWLDLGEPETHDMDGSTKHHGGTFEEVHNEFGLLWMAGVYDVLKEKHPDMRQFLLPRAGTAGMQRYSAFPWTGDIQRSWNGLKAQVPALVSASMSGIGYLGSDIGGFTDNQGPGDANYLRWVQLGVFYPMLRTHSKRSLNPEPYMHNYLNEVREAINLRYAYLPYTYSQSYQYTAFGTPIARPANFDDSDKSRLANSIDTYYWGPDLYVAPMLSEGTSRSISLPEGEWLDANDFKTVYDSKIDNYPVPYNKLARFMRKGSFLTRYRESSFTSTADIQTDKITVDYFLNYQDYSGNNSHKDFSAGSKWYDDDHTTVNPLKDNSYLLTHFHGHGVVNGTNHAVVLYIDREGDGWDGMYSRADGENRWTRSEDSNFEGEQYDGQDILLAIHKIKCDGGLANNIEINLHDYGPRPAAASEAENSIDAAPAADDVDPKEIWPKRYAMKAISADDIKNAQTFENGKIKDKDSEGFCLDRENETLYVRMPKLDPRRNYALLIGNKGEIVNVGEVNLAAMTLEYADGCFTYSAPEGTESLTLGVYSTTGACMGLYEGLTADGVADQVSVSLPQGVYIGRLTGRDASGASVVKTVKVMVK